MKQQITLEQLEKIVAQYVSANKIAQSDFQVTKDNIVGLIDKVGKMLTLETSFYDKLTEMNGDNLPLGKTIEEWYQDLIPVSEFTGDKEGNEVLKFYSPSYRPVAYSYTLGRKVFKVSIPYGNIERACTSEAVATDIVSTISKRLWDSIDMHKYALKRELIGRTCDMIENALTGATAWTASVDIVEGKYYKVSDLYYVAVQNHTHASGDTIAKLLEAGVIVPFLMKQVVKKPVDTETGEAFLIALKSIVEKAEDVSEGYSFNGNTIGAEVGLACKVNQGILPNLDVKTYAGAFHLDKVVPNVEMQAIKDFGSTTSKAFAILYDRRALKLHTGYEAVRDNSNGAGDFLNMFAHREYTAFISRNAFITIFCEE